MLKTRCFPENNYFSVWQDGKTTRFQIEDDKPITKLKYPEFYDIKLTNKCDGKCPWCYQDSSDREEHTPNIVESIFNFFGPMSKNERPFQVALGGGNPNEHPDFIEVLKTFDSLGIVPNYTTNGMGITPEICYNTEKYCGGVAVSLHPHLEEYWSNAIWEFDAYKVPVINAHIIISDKESIDFFKSINYTYGDMLKYFVLLPYEAMGRAEPKEIDYEYLTEILDGLDDIKNVAFGAGFYEYLKTKDYSVSLYEPELMSAYLDLSNMKVYKSSFNLEEI